MSSPGRRRVRALCGGVLGAALIGAWAVSWRVSCARVPTADEYVCASEDRLRALGDHVVAAMGDRVSPADAATFDERFFDERVDELVRAIVALPPAERELLAAIPDRALPRCLCRGSASLAARLARKVDESGGWCPLSMEKKERAVCILLDALRSRDTTASAEALAKDVTLAVLLTGKDGPDSGLVVNPASLDHARRAPPPSSAPSPCAPPPTR